MEADKKYQEFLAKHEYKEGGAFLIAKKDNIVRLYKFVGEIEL